MNKQLVAFLNDNYKDAKSDLFSAFIVRIIESTVANGFIGLMTPFNWMFLSSFEKLRNHILDNCTLTNLVRPEFHAFFDSAFVTICGFTMQNRPNPKYRGAYIDLQRFYGADLQPEKTLEALRSPDCGWFYRASAEDFKKIPGSPIAYWVSDQYRSVFVQNESFSSFFFSDGLTKTGDNEKFLRFHWELDQSRASNKAAFRICVKGGEARKYYGNIDVLVNWSESARNHYRSDNVARITPEYLWESQGISWTKISSKGPTFRWFGNGMIAETGGPAIFSNCDSTETNFYHGLSFLSSCVCWNILSSMNPTLNFQTNDVLKLPFTPPTTKTTSESTKKLISLSRADWDSFETSWDFLENPLVSLAREVGG